MTGRKLSIMNKRTEPGRVGLALGNSLLVEENGTTEFGGGLLRYIAAEMPAVC